MQVQQIVVTGQLEVELLECAIDTDRLGPEEILVKTERTFISAGTELANYTGTDPTVFIAGSWNAYPWRSGYANVGRVVAAGSAVQRAQVGERVPHEMPRRQAGWPKELNAAVEAAVAAGQVRPPEGGLRG